jgi:hypothetical protein
MEVCMNNQNSGSETLHTRSGYTIDNEGHLNNYAVEPEMYMNEPGDLRQQQQEARLDRQHELAELQEDELGKLTLEHDYRHRGPGLV